MPLGKFFDYISVFYKIWVQKLSEEDDQYKFEQKIHRFLISLLPPFYVDKFRGRDFNHILV